MVVQRLYIFSLEEKTLAEYQYKSDFFVGLQLVLLSANFLQASGGTNVGSRSNRMVRV